jgi:folate-binding protein YgfZ
LTAVTLSNLAVARVTGADAGSFLQAQLSADVAAIADGGASFACYCSPRGQVYGLLLVCRCNDEFRLVADAALLRGMLQRLGMFVLRARVSFELADDLEVSAYQSADPRDEDYQPGGFDLCYRCVAAGSGTASSQGAADWKEQELRRGIVWLGPQTAERFIPQMLGFDRIGAVSFGKGCYPGQEIIARARYLGEVKRKPLLLQIAGLGELPPGSSLKLLDDKEWLQGTVVDSVDLTNQMKQTLVFVVSPVPEGSVKRAEYEGGSYRCATI